MSDLIDRYLAAVARELPERERADIVAELRDELMSGIEAKEEGLGRPLTLDELRGELVAFGNPLVVAGRYRKVQHLVGPQVFPFWWAAVKATLTVMAVVYIVLVVLSVVADGHVSGLRVPSPVFAAGFAVGVITALCALAERYGKADRLARRWRPERLPPARGKRQSRFEMMTELAFAILFLLWWAGVIHFASPRWAEAIALAPVWAVWFWPILGYAAADVAAGALARPGPTGLGWWAGCRSPATLARPQS